MATLAQLVLDFERNGLIELQHELDHHGAQPDGRAAVFAAASWRGPRGRVHARQRRMARTVKQAAGEALRKARFDTKAMDRFESLMGAVQRAIGGLHGVGEVTVYDAALRIGASCGCLPSRVRLHGTSRESAALLGLAVGRRRWIETDPFPSELRQLRPWEIERFLSSYRDELETLATRDYAASLRLAVASHMLGRSGNRAA